MLVRTGATTAQIEFVRVLNNAYQLDAPFNVSVADDDHELLPQDEVERHAGDGRVLDQRHHVDRRSAARATSPT